MTYNEYRQLRAYARYDGIYLGVIWVASFACMIGITTWPFLNMLWMMLALSTPFFVAHRLKKYRDNALDGIISFKRGFAYCLRVFFHSALLLAIMQWAYMHFLDHGHLAQMLQTIFDTPQSHEVMKQVRMDAKELITVFSEISPLQFAVTYFGENIMIGLMLSFPIALISRRTHASAKQRNINKQ